jgi:hypothetical protein
MAPAGFLTWSEHVPAAGPHAVKLQVRRVTDADAGAAVEAFNDNRSDVFIN